eukprot:IDg20891t1
MTVDLRPVNSATIRESWPMPHLESELQDFRGATCFASIDFVSGYWQLPLHPESYKHCGIITPRGVFVSKRVLQGLTNAVSHFQRSVEPLFASLRNCMKAWLDDFTGFARTESELLDMLEKFFKICMQRNLYLSARKSTLFTREVKWCGRIINKNGYKMDPARIEGLKSMHMPQTAEELNQFIHCLRWMSRSIPNFEKRVAPLIAVVDEAFQISGKRTKRSIRKIKLNILSWKKQHEDIILDFQASLKEAVTLTHPDVSKTICIYTDASKHFWSGVVTQCNADELAKSIEKQVHEPLAFLGSGFRGPQLHWTTFEQEGFAIFQVFLKLDYILLGHEHVHVFTDHRNLLFVFAPLAVEPALGRNIVSKIQRWALFLSRFSYTIEHIAGVDNVFADILTRWLKNYREDTKGTLLRCNSLIAVKEQLIPAANSFDWPNMDEIRNSQRKHESKKPTEAIYDNVSN